MSDKENQQTGFEQIKQRYLDALPSKIVDIQNNWKILKEQLTNFKREIHNISGVAETFGLPALGEAARKLEHRLVLPPPKSGLNEKDSIQMLIDDLEAAAKKQPVES